MNSAILNRKAISFVKFAFVNFGPLILFYVVNHFTNLKAAIATSTVYSALEIGYRVYHRQEITSIFKFTAILTLIFGLVDLYVQQPFLLKYESVLTNIFTGLFFAASLFGERSLIKDFYLKSENPKPMTCDRVAYFRYLTTVWVLYFFVKAGAYFWVAGHLNLESGMAVRVAIGTGSLYAMMFVSIVGSKRIFPLLKRWHLLPEPGEVAAIGNRAVSADLGP